VESLDQLDRPIGVSPGARLEGEQETIDTVGDQPGEMRQFRPVREPIVRHAVEQLGANNKRLSGSRDCAYDRLCCREELYWPYAEQEVTATKQDSVSRSTYFGNAPDAGQSLYFRDYLERGPISPDYCTDHTSDRMYGIGRLDE